MMFDLTPIELVTLRWVYSTCVLGYLIGSIPFGLLLTRLAGAGDVRDIGSGNIGATNVMRTGRKGLALLTLLLDGGKGFAAVWLAGYLYRPEFTYLAGLCAVLGHIFPIWLRFKGGKGVATSMGVFMALDWPFGFIICSIWLIVFLCLRISALAGLLSIANGATIAYLLDDMMTGVLALCLGVLMVFTHRGNIKRLLEGEEHRFPRKKP